MKNILKEINLRIVLFSLLSFFLLSCDKEDYIGPKVKIYKTKGDYFNKVNTWGNDNGPIGLDYGSRIIINNGDTIYAWRWKLADGYVMAGESSSSDYFTDMTFAEIVAYKDKYPDSLEFPRDSFFKRVIDKDPYTEYYIAKEYSTFEMPDSNDVEPINELIRKGELENYFKRLK